MANLTSIAKAFLHYCKRKDSNEMSYIGDVPLKNLIDSLSTHPNFAGRITLDLTENYLCGYAQEPAIKEKERFDNDDAAVFLESLSQYLEKNRIDNWILIPLRHAHLSSSVRYKNFIFLSGSLEEKADTLRKIGKNSRMQTQHIMNNIIRKSPGFFEHPILAIRIKDHNESVHQDVHNQAFYCITFLQAIYWGQIYPAYRYPQFARRFSDKKTDHMMLFGENNWQHSTIPFRIDATCNLNLDWLLEKKHIKLFDSLYQSFLSNTRSNKLRAKFRTGFRFFKKAIESEERGDYFERLGLPVMNLVIASETVLLPVRAPKRFQLSFLMPGLTKLTDLNESDSALITSEMYTLRSEYVHGGTEVYHDFDDGFGPGELTTKYTQYKRMVARVLLKYPYYEKLVVKRSATREVYLNEWHAYLRRKIDGSRSINPELWDNIKPKKKKCPECDSPITC
ncbi:HEPN domain-containing protein [Paenibacillus amylolyticus]|uniref:HEPN domain-containing protein n=1 Tax=Paenibacillus amylolyticus TaxID=1451 RepID=UPI00201DFBE7|nr:HEPN domain-containing protein [Paenibacillus amylolyticus]MCL6663505.1 HEPN domain-containing protein [Paenibacillus amylolyticus]